jgi:hypothetical protein
MMDWISVKDELPEKYDEVLFWADNEAHFGVFRLDDWSSALIDDQEYGGSDIWAGSYKMAEVAWWMPIELPGVEAECPSCGGDLLFDVEQDELELASSPCTCPAGVEDVIG